MGLNPIYRDFAERFADAIVAKDFSAAHQLLAPWLQKSVTPKYLAQIIQDKVKEIAEANELDGEFHPGSYEIDWNTCSLEDLNSPRSFEEDRSIPEEVTDKNYRQWMVIQFQPGKEEMEIDAYLDWWMAVVEQEDGEYKIGYFEIEYPD